MKMLFYQSLFVASLFFVSIAPQAATITNIHDPLNRLTNTAYSDGSRESYSYDPAGNRLSRVTQTATTKMDVAPPAVPENLATNNFTPGQVRLDWGRSYDTGGSGLAGYRVYVNGILVADTTTTSFLLTGLLLDTEYCFTVAAYDHYTNISAVSPPLCLYIPSGAGSATIKITPILLAAQPSPSWTIGVDVLITDVLANAINTNTAFADPGNYAVCNQRINWYNLAFSQSIPMWDGVLNPPAPWNNEYGHVVWALIDARSNSHSDDLSLDSLQVIFVSNDGNALGATLGFATNTSYTPRALAVKKDGTRITAGPSSQKGTRILILVRSKLFTGGDTQSGLDQIKNWILGHSPYTLTYEAEIIGDEEATRSLASVSVAGQTPVTPRLSLTLDGTLSVVFGEIDRIYIIQATDAIENSWTNFGAIGGTNSIKIPVKTNANQFFRAVVQ